MSLSMNGHLATVARNTESLTPLGQEMVAELQVDASLAFGELTIACHRDRIVEVLTSLKDRFGFQQLLDVCGVDYPDRAERFDVVYHLISLTRNARIRVKVHDRRSAAGAQRHRGLSVAPAGSSARRSTCTACCSRATRTCAGC